MKQTTPRFDLAADALVKGYLNETLAKGHPCGCAAGHIVARSTERVIVKRYNSFCWSDGDEYSYSHWNNVFATHRSGVQVIQEINYEGEAKAQIDATGYSWRELARIEKAFETATKIWYTDYPSCTPESVDADQYNGLVAVFRVLCENEGIADSSPYVPVLSKEVV